MRGQVIPGEVRRIPGFRSVDPVRRERDQDFEFMTLMWFGTLDAVKAFKVPGRSDQPPVTIPALRAR